MESNEEEDLSFERFENKFKLLKGDTILIDTTFISKASFSHNVLYVPLVEKYLLEDSMSTYTVRDKDTTLTFVESIIPCGRIKFSGLNFTGYLARISTGSKRYFLDLIRLYSIKGEKLQQAHNIALMATDAKALLGQDLSNHFIVTATIIDSVIYQYAVGLLYHEEPTKEERIGGSKEYYFTLQDTLETSKLVLLENGELIGKNLTQVPDN